MTGELGPAGLSDPGPRWPESSEGFAAPGNSGPGRVVRSSHPGVNEDEAAVRKGGQGRGKDPEPFLLRFISGYPPEASMHVLHGCWLPCATMPEGGCPACVSLYSCSWLKLGR